MSLILSLVIASLNEPSFLIDLITHGHSPWINWMTESKNITAKKRNEIFVVTYSKLWYRFRLSCTKDAEHGIQWCCLSLRTILQMIFYSFIFFFSRYFRSVLFKHYSFDSLHARFFRYAVCWNLKELIFMWVRIFSAGNVGTCTHHLWKSQMALIFFQQQQQQHPMKLWFEHQ